MPHIDITMVPGRDEATKREVANKVHGFLAKELGINPRFLSVSIEDVPKEKWNEHIKKFEGDTMYVKPDY